MAGERTLPGLGLTGFWNLGDSTWKTGMDANLRTLSALTQLVVKSAVTSLPATPTLGDVYIVPSGAVSNANEIAVWDGSSGAEAWVYVPPFAGIEAYVADEQAKYRYSGSAWAEIVSGGGGASTFVGLTDTPSAFTDEGGKYLRVNTGATALEFVSAPSAGGGGTLKSLIVPAANQSIGTSQVNVDLDTAVYDDALVFDVGTPDRVTVPVSLNGGRVRLSASVRTTAFNLDNAFSVALRKNGSDFFPGVPFQAKEAGIGAASSNIISAWIPVVTGDYFELQVGSPQQSATLNHDATWLQVEAETA